MALPLTRLSCHRRRRFRWSSLQFGNLSGSKRRAGDSITVQRLLTLSMPQGELEVGMVVSIANAPSRGRNGLRCVRFREARTGVEGEAGEIAGDDFVKRLRFSSMRDIRGTTGISCHSVNVKRFILSMATTTISMKPAVTRAPTRLAFILSHPDRDLVLSVIARATTLWGGLFNPIILDDSTRKTAGVHYTALPPDPYLATQSDLAEGF